MSRIGRMPVNVPADVQVSLAGNKVTVKGAKGELEREFHPAIKISMRGTALYVERPDDSKMHRSLHGLSRALLANMVTGVSAGFSKQLVIEGTGYRGEQQGDNLVMQLGFSHPVRIVPPPGIKVSVDGGGRLITVEGIDKELVGEVAAKIRAVRKPEPYKGVGIAYKGETIRRKAGKAGKGGSK